MHGRQKTERPGSRPPFSPSRSIGLAFAMSGHLALLLLLLGPVGPPTQQEKLLLPQPKGGTLSARLISRALPAKALPATPLEPPRTPPIRVRSALPRTARAMNPMVVAPAPPATTTTKTPAPYSDHASDYVSGGRSFSGALLPSVSPSARLPGGARVDGAPAIRMIDPRSHGMAGVARFLLGLTGAADPACVDADAWSTMSEEERIARHTSAADVTRIVIDHNCPLPPLQRGHQ